jgi:hypothetical protein
LRVFLSLDGVLIRVRRTSAGDDEEIGSGGAARRGGDMTAAKGRKGRSVLSSAMVADELRMSYVLRAALDVNAADTEGDVVERMSKFVRRVRGSLGTAIRQIVEPRKPAVAQARARIPSRYHKRKERDIVCLFTGRRGVHRGR